MFGTNTPTWTGEPGPVRVRKYVRDTIDTILEE